jgi:hypothetical protein
MEKQQDEQQLNNFRKVNFLYKGSDYELGISLYSKLIMVILTDNCKFGNMYIGELEEEDIMVEDESDFMDVKCILGDRNNEESQFLANFAINYIFTGLKKAGNTKIQKVLVSSSIRRGTYSDETGLTNDYKELLTLVRENIATLLNI